MDSWASMSGSLFSIQLQHGRYRAGIDDIQETRNRRESVRLLTLSHVFSPVHANQPRASSASHKLLSTTVWARFSHELVYDVWCGIVGGVVSGIWILGPSCLKCLLGSASTREGNGDQGWGMEDEKRG